MKRDDTATQAGEESHIYCVYELVDHICSRFHRNLAAHAAGRINDCRGARAREKKEEDATSEIFCFHEIYIINETNDWPGERLHRSILSVRKAH